MSRYSSTATPFTPVSPASTLPLSFTSNHTRFPSVSGSYNPKSTVVFVVVPVAPTTTGSFPGVSVTAPLQIIPLGATVPLSSSSTLLSGSGAGSYGPTPDPFSPVLLV